MATLRRYHLLAKQKQMASNKVGQCATCERDTTLTLHHLIPKKVHRRAHFKKHYDKQTLNQGILLCRTCHSGIHKRCTEMQLAKELNSLEKLKKDPDLQRFFDWVKRQKIA